jgi:hypothetical protein
MGKQLFLKEKALRFGGGVLSILPPIGVWRIKKRETTRSFQTACLGAFSKEVGSGLLSHAASSTVPSALVGLTSGFGMGPGVPPQL